MQKILLFMLGLVSGISILRACELIDQPHWFVVANVCNFDDVCIDKKIPVDADNEVACQMTSWKSVVEWVTQNHYRSWNIKANCTTDLGSDI